MARKPMERRQRSRSKDRLGSCNQYLQFMGTTNWAGGGNSTSSGPNFLGRLWTNGLSMSGGSLIIKVPESRPSQFCPLPDDCPIGRGESPDVDWIARSITQSSNF
jgi:hypothetical protein